MLKKKVIYSEISLAVNLWMRGYTTGRLLLMLEQNTNSKLGFQVLTIFQRVMNSIPSSKKFFSSKISSKNIFSVATPKPNFLLLSLIIWIYNSLSAIFQQDGPSSELVKSAITQISLEINMERHSKHKAYWASSSIWTKVL